MDDTFPIVKSMRALVAAYVVYAVSYPSISAADPRSSARDDYQRAVSLEERGDYEDALVSIERGLATASGDLRIRLLGVKGAVLLKLRDYAAALAAYQAYLDAGATGASRREAQRIVRSLGAVTSTFVDIAIANGPATVYLDSKSLGVFCTAAPACRRAILPGRYTLIAERRGFERSSTTLSVENGRTAAVTIALVESPSSLSLRIIPPGAVVMIDETASDAPTSVAAGVHRITVSLAGYVTETREITAHEGAPVQLELELVPLVPLRIVPPSARVTLDGKPAAIDGGSIAVPPGRHALVARAPGYRDQRIDIPAQRASDYRLVVELPRIVPPLPAPSIFTTRRKVAISAAGGAVAAVAVGASLGVQARHLDARAVALCGSTSTPCSDAAAADDLNVRARSRARDANIAFGIAGGVALAAGLLWFTGAPEARVTVAPRIGSVSGLDVAVRF